MDTMVNRLIAYFLKNDWIDQEDIPWAQYKLKNIIATTVGIIPFLLIAFLLVGFWETVFFFGSFFLLRRYCNGYHAKTLLACLISSMLIELAFLLGLRRLLQPVVCLGVNIFSVLLLLKLAPYDHPNMHYTQEELTALKESIWKTIAVLEVVFILSLIFPWPAVMTGLTSGIAMTAFLLCLAYFAEWRNKSGQNQQCNSQDS